jgi:hypothetical protein
MNEPKRLLEILILSRNYFNVETNNDNLIYYAYANTNDFVKFIESTYKISKGFPYPEDFNKYDYQDLVNQDTVSLKAINAMVTVADKLSIEELIATLQPQNKEHYNQNFKTEDFEDYNALSAFLLTTQYKRLLAHRDKQEVFKLCYYYWNEEFISWPVNYFLAELLLQINQQTAKEYFYQYFEEIPTEGSFLRQGILKALIKFDFEDNKNFIEIGTGS